MLIHHRWGAEQELVGTPVHFLDVCHVSQRGDAVSMVTEL